MLVRNISDQARLIASPTHDFWSDEIAPDAEADVPDAVGKSLCEQTDVWALAKKEPAKAADKGDK